MDLGFCSEKIESGTLGVGNKSIQPLDFGACVLWEIALRSIGQQMDQLTKLLRVRKLLGRGCVPVKSFLS